MFNTNLIHNILNLIGLIIGAFLTVDWTAFGMTDSTAARVAAGVLLLSNLVKMTMNLTRDGASGIVKPQPPVSQAPADDPAAIKAKAA